MTDFFSAETADEAWKQAYKRLIADTDQAQGSRLGKTRETLHASFHIYNPRQRWILSRQPAINPAFAIAEVFWILSGDNKSKFLNYWNPILPQFAGDGSTYYGAYGYRIRNNFKLDQLEMAYQALKNNPDSRQVVIQIWDSNKDFPDSNGAPRDMDIPCNICAMPKIRDGKLEWLQVMRSNDLHLGTPHNIIQFTSLQEILAGWLEVEVGGYHLICDSLHIYEKDIDKISCSKSNQPQNPDDIAIQKEAYDSLLPLFISALHTLTDSNLTIHRFETIIKKTDFPTSYKNLLLICAADCARRKRWQKEMLKAHELCSNPLLKTAFTRWLERYPI